MNYEITKKDNSYFIRLICTAIFPQYVSHQLLHKLQDDVMSKKTLDIYFDNQKVSGSIISCAYEYNSKNNPIDVWVEPTQEIEVDIVKVDSIEVNVKISRDDIDYALRNILDNNLLEAVSGNISLDYRKFGKKITKEKKLTAVINYDFIDKIYFEFITEPSYSDTKDFLPCPCCGKQPDILWTKEKNNAYKAKVSCSNPFCNIHISTAKLQIPNLETRKDVFETVKKYWNTRYEYKNKESKQKEYKSDDTGIICKTCKHYNVKCSGITDRFGLWNRFERLYHTCLDYEEK